MPHIVPETDGIDLKHHNKEDRRSFGCPLGAPLFFFEVFASIVIILNYSALLYAFWQLQRVVASVGFSSSTAVIMPLAIKVLPFESLTMV